jgi:transposase
MPPTLPQSKQDLITTRLEEGVEHKKIVKESGVSLSQVRKMSSNFNHFGSVVVPKVRIRGRPPTLDTEMIEESTPVQQTMIRIKLIIGVESLH